MATTAGGQQIICDIMLIYDIFFGRPKTPSTFKYTNINTAAKLNTYHFKVIYIS